MSAVLPSAEESKNGPPLSTDEVRDRLGNLTDSDHRKLAYWARRLMAGVPGVEPTDLVQEAFTRLLEGTRKHPEGIPTMTVVFNVMKSVAFAARRQGTGGAIDWARATDTQEEGERSLLETTAADSPTPEDVVVARDLLSKLDKHFDGDETARLVLEAWADGIRGAEAAEVIGVKMNEYEAARKRIFRAARALHDNGSTK